MYQHRKFNRTLGNFGLGCITLQHTVLCIGSRLKFWLGTQRYQYFPFIILCQLQAIPIMIFSIDYRLFLFINPLCLKVLVAHKNIL